VGQSFDPAAVLGAHRPIRLDGPDDVNVVYRQQLTDVTCNNKYPHHPSKNMTPGYSAMRTNP